MTADVKPTFYSITIDTEFVENHPIVKLPSCQLYDKMEDMITPYCPRCGKRNQTMTTGWI